MKIQFNAVLGSISAKVDGSLGLRLNTPELTPEEKAIIMGIQNKTLDVVVEEIDEPSGEMYKIDRELTHKTPSERMRASLYVLWDKKQRKTWQDFNAYYAYAMEKMIDNIKSQIE